MIDKNSLDINWINEVSKSNRNADKILVEKAIRALLLLEGLVKAQFDFIFKGGSALMLMSDSPKRFSIDIDVIMEKEPQDIEKKFQKIIKAQHFTGFKQQHRSPNSKIRKAHYKFFYEPVHRTGASEEYILLDIVFEKLNYQRIINLPIKSRFFISKGDDLLVELPSVDDLLGDKLTAFAPNTSGIPYFKKGHGMSMEIIKQLYDIGTLFNKVNNVKTLSKTFKKFSETELYYRGKDHLGFNDVIDDVFQTSLCIASRGNAGEGNYHELEDGIQRLTNYVFSESFHLEKAIPLASIAAYIASVIKYGQERIEIFKDPLQMDKWNIDNTLWTRINRLKKSNPEAFFYWYKIHELGQI